MLEQFLEIVGPLIPQMNPGDTRVDSICLLCRQTVQLASYKEQKYLRVWH